MSHWSAAPMDRNQVVLFAPTLDQSLADDHPVRLFAETLAALDFADWERTYVRVVGQPPIHPRVLAGCILYGLSLGVRSSRRLEDAAANRLDFIWLLEGRVPDHATICKFRTAFGPQIKGLFRQVGRVAIELGLVALNRVMLDGTHVQANNSRYATNRRASLQEKLDALDAQVERLLAEADSQDRADAELFGGGGGGDDDGSPSKLPRGLRDLRARQERLRRAMRNLGKMEQERRDRGQSRGPAVPVSDPDARVLPAKQGGYAPGYTAVLATDARSGFVLDAQVIAGNDEPSTVLPAVANLERDFGRKPDELITDSGFNSGPNLQGLAGQNVTPLMPPRQAADASAARQRPDPAEPVPEADRGRLPVNPQNKTLDRAAFVYDPAGDRYHCPMGKPMGRVEDKPYDRHGTKGTYRVYQSPGCGGCPLAATCLGKTARVRRVCRDEYEELRERMAERMNSEAGKAAYRRRGPVAEAAFATLKAVMNLRQYLLRGLDKVRIETDWAATALNLTKLIRLTAR
jgi:transposase